MSYRSKKIDPSDDDFGAVVNCAIRYCLGRQTYMPMLVMDFVRPYIPKLTDKTLWCIERDIEEAKNREYGLGNFDIDKPRWLEFLSQVQAEIKKRDEAAK